MVNYDFINEILGNIVIYDVTSIGGTMKDKSYILYILGAIIAFLLFGFSMIFVDSLSILVLVGMFGMWGMMYCINKLLDNKNNS